MEDPVQSVKNILNIRQAEEGFDLLRYGLWLDKLWLRALRTPWQTYSGHGWVQVEGIHKRVT